LIIYNKTFRKWLLRLKMTRRDLHLRRQFRFAIFNIIITMIITICFFFFFLVSQLLNRRVHRFFVRVSSDFTRYDVPTETTNIHTWDWNREDKAHASKRRRYVEDERTCDHKCCSAHCCSRRSRCGARIERRVPKWGWVAGRRRQRSIRHRAPPSRRRSSLCRSCRRRGPRPPGSPGPLRRSRPTPSPQRYLQSQPMMRFQNDIFQLFVRLRGTILRMSRRRRSK